MNISLVQGGAALPLNGAGAPAPVVDARFMEDALREVEVACEGSPGEIAALTDAIGVKLFEAQRCYGLAGEEWVFVHVTLADGAEWRSPLQGGSLTSLNGLAGRAGAQQVLRVKLDRAGYWEKAALQYAALSNRHGSSAGPQGLSIYNHGDDGHDCFVDLAAPEGDLPAPAVLSFSKSDQAGLEIYAGSGVYLDLPNAGLFLEGEDGVSGAGVTASLQASAAASSGHYVQLAWSGSAEVTLRHFTLGVARSSALAGRVYRPVVRLQSAIAAGERMWLRAALNYEQSGLLEPVCTGEAVLLPTDRLMIALPPLALPPWPVLGASSQSVNLSLHACEEGGGSNSLNLDAITLLPLDSTLRLIPLVTSYPNTLLTYDCQTRLLLNEGKSIQTHFAEGPGIELVPGRPQRLVFVTRTGAGWDIHLNPQVNVQYRPRKRTL